LDGQFVPADKMRNFESLDTRSREIRHKDKKQKVSEPFLVTRQYRSSVGIEYFIAFEDEYGYLYGFTRLLLPKDEETVDFPGLGVGTALIRELHVYGTVAKINSTSKQDKQQHR
jgi:histone acetyltransferase (RNA polymerase elongator complex component)